MGHPGWWLGSWLRGASEGKVGFLWLPPVEATHAEAQPGGCRRPWGGQSQLPSLMAVELPTGLLSLSEAHWCHRKRKPLVLEPALAQALVPISAGSRAS